MKRLEVKPMRGVFCLLVLVLSAVGAAAADARTWTDRTGRQLDAEFVSFSNGIVRIKRTSDGRTFDLPLERFSDADIAFVRAQPAAGKPLPIRLDRVDTAAKLEKLAAKARTARECVSLYQLFLSDPAPAEAEKAKAKARLPHWEQLSQQQSERIGSRWYRQDEILAMRTAEAKLYAEAMRLWDLGDFDLAARKFGEASRAYPDSIRSDFRLGVLRAILGRDAKSAADHFETCIRLRMGRVEQLSQVERANLVAALNNLAVTKIRQREPTAALQQWQRAINLGLPPPEIAHNLAVLTKLASDPTRIKIHPRLAIRLTPAEQERLGEVYLQAVRSREGDVLLPKTGWLYMALVPEGKEGQPPREIVAAPTPRPLAEENAPQLRLVGSGTGFVIHSGHVLTCAHVAQDADALQIVSPTDAKVKFPASPLAVSKARELDLAILSCPQLDAPPLPLCTNVPLLGQEVRLLGFPLPDQLGTSLKVTRGTIAGLPPHEDITGELADFHNYYLYDAVINPGNSGGPACNELGQVVAVNSAILLPGAVGGGYAAGVPAPAAVSFLQTNLPQFVPADPAARNDSSEHAVERVGKSTVQVLVFQAGDRLTIGDQFRTARQRKPKWNAYEDPWCLACNGVGQIACPVKECRGGWVATFRQEPFIFPDGARILRKVPDRVPCNNCGRTGFVPCRCCVQGLDPAFLD